MSFKKVFVAGHKGMVGSSICRLIKNSKNFELLTASRDELDLLSQTNVQKFLKKESPDIVIQAAAKVGGIHANNTYPAEFIYQNLMILNFRPKRWFIPIRDTVALESSSSGSGFRGKSESNPSR